jgi:drug/metabolite transporter (DMT)-like permease
VKGESVLPTVLVLLAGIMWSFSGVLIKGIHWNAFAIAGSRSLVGGALEFAFLVSLTHFAVRNRADFDQTPALADSCKTVLRRILALQPVHWLGALSFMLNMIALVFAFQLTNVATAVFLHYSGIVLVALLSWPILRQPLTSADWLAVGGALAGIAILSIDGAQSTGLPGVALGIFCGITMATTQICLGLRAMETNSGAEAIETIVLANVLMTIIALPIVFTAPPPMSGSNAWLLLIVLGIVPWAIPDILYAVGIKRVPVFRAMILGLSDPILTAVWPFLFLSERPSSLALCGALVILSAIVYQAKYSSRASIERDSCCWPNTIKEQLTKV